MNTAWRIASEEWRYWFRSRLAISATLLLLVMVLAAVVSTISRVQSEVQTRQSLQAAAEEAFLSQPDRHPHRMVHYGHYVFRTPAPLAVIDPGVDPLTGTVMFLEGHRQNSATFPAAYTAPRVAGFEFLTPAFTYQVLVPLVLIVVGFSVVARERELHTDVQLTAQGVSARTLWLGKSLSLIGFSTLLVLPLAAGTLYAVGRGESPATAFTLVLAYFAYLAFWSFTVVAISSRAKTAAMSLLWCCVAWVVVAVVIPRVASDMANTLTPVAGKISTDMALIEEMRALGDGHNAADPAFASLKARVLDQYGADSAEELPVNMRGIIAEASEEKLTKLLNRFAETRMQNEVQQASVLKSASFFSPMMAIRNASMQAVGSGLDNHHRFLREAETARYDFVQKLNRAHVTELSYIDDINRNNNDAAGMKARISADNWRVLQSFDFQPAQPADRVRSAGFGLLVLLVWCAVAATLSYRGVGQTEGRYHAK